jgi:hypothetical protein
MEESLDQKFSSLRRAQDRLKFQVNRKVRQRLQKPKILLNSTLKSQLPARLERLPVKRRQ